MYKESLPKDYAFISVCGIHLEFIKKWLPLFSVFCSVESYSIYKHLYVSLRKFVMSTSFLGSIRHTVLVSNPFRNFSAFLPRRVYVRSTVHTLRLQSAGCFYHSGRKPPLLQSEGKKISCQSQWWVSISNWDKRSAPQCSTGALLRMHRHARMRFRFGWEDVSLRWAESRANSRERELNSVRKTPDSRSGARLASFTLRADLTTEVGMNSMMKNKQSCAQQYHCCIVIWEALWSEAPK